MKEKITKLPVVALLGSLHIGLPLDWIEPMLGHLAKALSVRFSFFRVIPEPGKSPLAIWADRQLQDETIPLQVYASRDFGGPTRRNNLVITGEDQRDGTKAGSGASRMIIMLGPIPPHYEVTKGEETRAMTSTHEALFEYWGRQEMRAVTMVQVLSDGKQGFKVHKGTNGKWYFLEGSSSNKTVLRKALPKPVNEGRAESLRQRSVEAAASFMA
jgi:hypothetical protein